MAVTAYDRPLEPLEREPKAPGQGEVLVGVAYCGICRSDLKVIRGQMPFSSELKLPHVPGHEISGVVAAVGDGVAIPVGTRIAAFILQPCGECRPCLEGVEHLCARLVRWVGFTDEGGFQEEIVLPSDRVLPLPADIQLAEAAPISCAIATAYRAAVTRARIRPGERVGLVGCGGVGIHVLQIAVLLGATVFAVEVSEQARAGALGHGATAAIDPKDGDPAQALLALSPGGLDAMIETSGVPALVHAAVRAVRPGGRVVLVGYRVGVDASFPFAETVLHEIELLGSRYATRGEVRRAIDLVARGRVRTVVRRILPLAAANEALHMLDEEGPGGRIVLEVGGR